MRFRVENLVAGYQRAEVLHGVSIEAPEGSRIGLFGPNGHGKTTLLRAISGMVAARSGAIWFGDENIARIAPSAIVERGIVHVPQGSSLFPRMTVLEALTLGAYCDRAWRRRRESLDLVMSIFPRLAERRSQLCSTLSGGERQMAAIGVGLMSRPKLLMLDEPTLGLAPRIRVELADAIHAVAKTGVSLIAVDQDIDLLFGLCPKLYLIEQGRVTLEVTDRSEAQHQEVLHRYFGSAA
jgi:branched-chain amino acid transport system ATP-binding protein